MVEIKQVKFPIAIYVDNMGLFYYNLEILPGQKPITSFKYILDYLNSVKDCNIKPNYYCIGLSHELFSLIFGTQEYYNEYISMIKYPMSISDSDVFQKIGIIDTKNTDRIIVLFKKEK